MTTTPTSARREAANDLRLRGWGISGAWFALALLVRLLPGRTVWLPDRVLFFDADAYYHMRRVFYTLAHFPATLGFDLYINYPEGARPIWTPLFDLGIAAALWPFVGGLGERDIEVAASWVPPLVGALGVLTLHRILRGRFGGGVAALAAGILAVLPAHVWYSQVGFVDHHCAVATMALVLLAAGLRFVEGKRFAVTGLGTALGLSLLLWPGMLLHVAIIESAIAGAIVTTADPRRAIADARRLAIAQGIALAWVAPPGLTSQWPQWSAASPVVLSHFQPWLFATTGATALAAAWIWSRWPKTALRPVSRLTSGSALAVGAVAASLALWPGLFAGFVESWQWISRSDAFQHLVGESRPLLVDGEDRFHLAPGVNNLSAFLLVAPIAIGFAVRAAWRSPRPAVLGMLLAFATVPLLAALLQRRFANTASIGLALLFALSLRALDDTVRRRTSQRRWRALGVAALGLATLGALAPGLLGYASDVATWLQGRGGVALQGQRYEWYALYDTSLWLRENTPPTEGWLDPERAPAYGIVGAWDVGHVIEYVGRRPTATDGFGDDIGVRNFLLVQDYFQGDEAGGVEILERLGARYVVVPHYWEFLATRPGPRSMYRALYDHDLAGPSEDADAIPVLAHHRLVFQHSRTARGSAARPPFKVFELVPGANVVGRTTPGATLEASLDIEPQGGRAFVYRASADADAEGRYRFGLPYASGGGQPAVRTGVAYRIACGDRAVSLRVGEAAVSQGRTLRGPDPCASEGT